MLGSIIGDIVGSVFEYNNIKSKTFSFFDENKAFTDDTILTIATAEWLLRGGRPGDYYYKWATAYPNPMGSYGIGFQSWIHQSSERCLAPAYNSCGNGSAMRVAPIGWFFDSLEETLSAAKTSAECTHNHPEGIKGAQAVTHAIFLARNNIAISDIKDVISKEYGYDLSMSVNDLQEKYSWDGIAGFGTNGATCQGSVPQAIICALEAKDFEDAIRNAISIGGDSDTIACITGGIAEALFGIPDDIAEYGISYLEEPLRKVLFEFNESLRVYNISKNTNITINNMTLSERIQKIIDHRKGLGEYVGQGYLDKIISCKSFFENLKAKVEDFEETRLKLIGQNENKEGEFYSYFTEDPTLIDRIKDASSTDTIKKIDECIKECERLYNRFNRDSINISVVGRARQGKSLLLQSISHLPDSVIPASNGGDCTGTTSIICNEIGAVRAYAKVEYYSAKEMTSQVNAYIEAIGLNYSIERFYDIPSLQFLVKKDKRKEMLSKMTSEKQSLFTHLLKYVEHYDECRVLVERGNDDINEEDIRNYVAQYDSEGNLTYNYLAVKEVRIYTEFTYAQAGKIVLVDTIGLGDTSLGIEEKMLKTLRDNSDAAFLVRLPASTGDHWAKEDNNLYDLIETAMGKNMLEKWLYLVFNTSDFLGNANGVASMEKNLENHDLHFADIIKVDCKNPAEVQEKLLLPALEHLATELKDVDMELMKDANKLFTSCCATYMTLYQHAHNIVIGSPASQASLTMFGIEHWDTIWPQITQAIGKLYSELSLNQYHPCIEVHKAINEAKENIYNFVPSEDWYLQEVLKMDDLSNPESVYIKGLNKFRSQISASFDNININVLGPLQEILKWQVANIMYNDALWSKLYIVEGDNKECSVDWLRAFANEKLAEFPNLRNAINFILDYQMSIADLLDYEVESSLGILTPGSREYIQLDLAEAQKQGADLDSNAMGKYIWERTINLVYKVTEKLDNEFDLLTKIPNHSLYARIRKFREKTVMNEATKKEMRQLYIQDSVSFWSEEYKEAIFKEQNYQQMMEWIELLPQSDKSCFEVNIQS